MAENTSTVTIKDFFQKKEKETITTKTATLTTTPMEELTETVNVPLRQEQQEQRPQTEEQQKAQQQEQYNLQNGNMQKKIGRECNNSKDNKHDNKEEELQQQTEHDPTMKALTINDSVEEKEMHVLTPKLSLLVPQQPQLHKEKEDRKETDNAGSVCLDYDNHISSPPPTVVVNRISINDPLMMHKHNWDTIILPRLRSFVDAIYSIRKDDDKRYRLLYNCCIASSTSASTPTSTTSTISGLHQYNSDNNTQNTSSSAATALAATWELLHHECPWLLSCDTAFFRQQQ